MANYLLIGAGGHAKVVADAALRAGHRLCAVLSESELGSPFLGLPVQSLQLLGALRSVNLEFVHVAIGNAQARARLSQSASALGYQELTIQHPNATVSIDASLGPGCFVAAGAVIAAGASIGRGCIINHRVSVDHDVQVGDWSHLAPGVVIGGHADIGEQVWVGLGSVIRDRARIGARSLIGAASLVLREIPEDSVAFGHPARVRRGAGQAP